MKPLQCYVHPAAGITAVALLNPAASLYDKAESASPGLVSFLATFVVNFTLNVFAISNITIRLLRHRRSVITIYGRKSAQAEHSLRISSILLESAAINIPLAVLSIVGLMIQADFAALLTQIITPGQVRYYILAMGDVSPHRFLFCFVLN